ncbi:MAG: hypothetical protein B7Z55_11525, partial [Planctomycetales bacterium 12-60-4]
IAELKSLGFIPRLFRHRRRLECWMADDANRSRVRCLVAAGGDGTVNELLARYPGVPLTVLPLGTENLLATYLQIPLCGKAVAAIVAGGDLRQIDVGCVGERRFVMCAGVGIDAAVIHAVHQARKGHITKWTYFWPTLRSLWLYPSAELVLTDDSGVEHSCRQILVFNLPRYALGLRFAPDAIGDDGFLDVRLFTGNMRRNALRFVWRAWWGILDRDPNVTRLRIRRAKITSVEPVAVHADGDPAGTTPIEVTVLPLALTLFVPSGRGSSTVCAGTPLMPPLVVPTASDAEACAAVNQ